MHIESMNRPVLALDDAHPAKKFLRAFIDCKENCVGRHHDWTGEKPIEQEWKSATDGRIWAFSAFAYMFLSFDIELDGFLENTPYPTESEAVAAQQLPILRALMDECAQAARQGGNNDILLLTDQVMTMLSLWEQYLSFRQETILRARQNESRA